jgi:hypothetical protein
MAARSESKLLSLLDRIIYDVKAAEKSGTELERKITMVVDQLDETANLLDLQGLQKMREVLYQYLGRSGVIPTAQSMGSAANVLIAEYTNDDDIVSEPILIEAMITPQVQKYVYSRLFGESRLIDTFIVDLFLDKFYSKLNLLQETTKCRGNEEQVVAWISHLVNTLAPSSITCPVYRLIDLTEKGATNKDQEKLFIDELGTCLAGDKRFMFFDFGHSGSFIGKDGKSRTGAHAGLVFIDKKRKTYERFEPHGQFESWDDKFVDKYFEQILPTIIPELKSYHYYKPLDICPAIGPQAMQADNKDCLAGGFCLIFALVYLHLRLIMPDEDPRLIIERLLKIGPTGLLSLVKRYVNWMELIVGT